MTSNYASFGVGVGVGVGVVGMSRTLHAPIEAHRAAAAAATIAVPRKRRVAADTIVASVNRGSI